MNARGFLFTCLALIVGSILLVPMSARLGISGNAASVLSSLSLLGGICAAFLTVTKEKDMEKSSSIADYLHDVPGRIDGDTVGHLELDIIGHRLIPRILGRVSLLMILSPLRSISMSNITSHQYCRWLSMDSSCMPLIIMI